MNKIYTLLILSTLSFNLMAGGEFSHEPIEVEKISTKYRAIKTLLPVLFTP